MMARMVGATSARAPSETLVSRVPFSPVTMKGTGSVCKLAEQESQLTGGVGSVGLLGLEVNHLLGVTVVRGDGEDVAGFLTRVVDGLDGLVGRVNGLDGGVVDTGVADLSGASV
jgi:hypothetical protein